ncbi:hypothetical protein [Paenibacillus sp. DMB5]|uniref:hypothetical protein n=1 Tax=Paenibacillus sp. DMB5 TaxID=1780103 RepID=UPI000AA23589|nr:hypothetical protein [Paenibacillus sp. DMB5]
MESATSYDLVITGGHIVTESAVERKDIGIVNGVISEISENIDPAGAAVVDARGLTVMPGVIDSHVHFNEPGLGSWEGFRTGSAALAAAGEPAFWICRSMAFLQPLPSAHFSRRESVLRAERMPITASGAG